MPRDLYADDVSDLTANVLKGVLRQRPLENIHLYLTRNNDTVRVSSKAVMVVKGKSRSRFVT